MKVGRNQLCPCGSGKKHKQCCLQLQNMYTVYCDETGNSGGNFLDTEQPFYVLAGWILPDTKVSDTSIIMQLKQQLSITDELHGVNLIRRKKGQRAILNFFKQLGKYGAVPIFIIAEKKYVIAAKVIETLLDPMYNDLVGNEYTYDNVMKKKLAEKIYELSYETLSEFAGAYSQYDTSSMIKAIKRLVSELDGSNQHDLSRKITGSLKYIRENLESEKDTHHSLPNKAMASLNVPVIISYLTMIEVFGRGMNSKLALVHDKTKQFEEAYQDIFNMYSKASPTVFKLTDGTPIVFGFKSLTSLTFKDSKECDWIQAADLLASAIGKCLKTVYKEENFTPEILDIAINTLPALLVEEIKIADIICSNDTKRKLGRLLRKALG